MEPRNLRIFQYDLTNRRFPSDPDAGSAEAETLAGAVAVAGGEAAEQRPRRGTVRGDDGFGTDRTYRSYRSYRSYRTYTTYRTYNKERGRRDQQHRRQQGRTARHRVQPPQWQLPDR